MNEIKINEEYKTLIPPLSPEEYQCLEENILKDGVREPLVTWNNTLIDGHNRYEICKKHGITYKTIDKEFQSNDEVRHWIILNQFGRRNLTKFQRSELALKLKPIISAQAKERQKRKPADFVPQNSAEQKSETREDLAKIAGVSRDTIQKVSVIQEKGSAEQIDRARKGGKGNTVNAIYNEVAGKHEDFKTCIRCGVKKPFSEFYTGKNVCKICCNNQKRLREPIRNFKGDIVAVMSDEIKNTDIDSVVNSLYDTDKVIEITADDLAEVISNIVSNFIKNVDRCISEYNVKITQQSEIKIRAALMKAEAAIQKMKGNI